MFYLTPASAFVSSGDSVKSKNGNGLESIIIETYAIHPQIIHSVLSDDELTRGWITYRIYADLAPGYKLQALFGVPGHPLRIQTTGTFYNNQSFGALSGCDINADILNNYSIAFDSWLSMGAATGAHLGALKEEDYDGSILYFDSLKNADGLISGFAPDIHYYNLTPYFFQYKDSSNFELTDAIWSVHEGVTGPTASNCILIAQLTTNGFISLELNMQLISPEREIEQYVAENPGKEEILFKGLKIDKFKPNHYETKSFAKDNAK
jgi:hypothetical protein